MEVVPMDGNTFRTSPPIPDVIFNGTQNMEPRVLAAPDFCESFEDLSEVAMGRQMMRTFSAHLETSFEDIGHMRGEGLPCIRSPSISQQAESMTPTLSVANSSSIETSSPPHHSFVNHITSQHRRSVSEPPGNLQRMDMPQPTFHRGGHRLGVPQHEQTRRLKGGQKRRIPLPQHGSHSQKKRCRNHPAKSAKDRPAVIMPRSAPLTDVCVPFEMQQSPMTHLPPEKTYLYQNIPFPMTGQDIRWESSRLCTPEQHVDPTMCGNIKGNPSPYSPANSTQCAVITIAMTPEDLKQMMAEVVGDAIERLRSAKPPEGSTQPGFVGPVGKEIESMVGCELVGYSSSQAVPHKATRSDYSP